MRRSRPSARRPGACAIWLAGLLSIGGATGCGTSDTETSVYLEIYDRAVVASATEVTLDILDPTGTQTIGTLDRTLAAQTSAATPLGSVVIVPGAHAALGALRIRALRSSGGTSLSAGTVDVALKKNRQVSARLQLGGPDTASDAGASDSGGADSGRADSGGADSSGADAGRADSGRADSGGADSGGADAGGGGMDVAGPADAGAADMWTGATDAGSDIDSGGATLLANGDSCQAGNACNSGFCADGVCCDNACTDLCHGCNLLGTRGTCKVFSAGSQCVPASCTVGDAVIPARTCDGNGNCGAASSAVSCGNYRCQNDACLRSCSNSTACAGNARCFSNRCL